MWFSFPTNHTRQIPMSQKSVGYALFPYPQYTSVLGSEPVGLHFLSLLRVLVLVVVTVAAMVVVEVTLLLLFHRWGELEKGNDSKGTQLITGGIPVNSRPFSKSSALA